MAYHPTSAPRLSGSILYTLIAVFSLTLITACGGGGLKLEANLNINDPRAVCATQPFNAICTEFTKERNAFIARCVAEDATVPAGICDSATTFVCTDNPFQEICDDTQEYLIKRDEIVTACAASTCSVPQQAQFCTDNPYHARCIDDTAYDTLRTEILATCGTATKHKRCAVAIVPVCEGNPFNIVCQGDATYEDARTSAVTTCNQGFIPLTNERCQNAITATCVGAGITNNPVLCDGVAADVTITATCNANRFDSACDDSEIYKEERRVFCLTPATASDNRCPAVVTSTCTDNPFHGLCLAGSTYDAPRNVAITDCIAVPIGVLCRDAIAHACTDNPFHALCLGASAATYASARRTAVTDCGDGTNVITTQVCIDAALQTCEADGADIFNAVCIASAAQPRQMAACGASPAEGSRCYLAEQINACAEGTETARCTGVSTNADIMTCIVDPFATACVDDSGFDSYLNDAQGARFTYCSADGVSATDTLCASYRACDTALTDGETIPAGCGGNFDATVRDACASDPFDVRCDGGLYDTARSEFCSINTPAEGDVLAVNNLFDPKCTTAYQDTMKRNTFCLADPFHASCERNVAYAEEREDNCAGDTPHAKCVTPGLHAAAHPADIPTTTTQTKFTDSFLHIVTLRDDGTLAPIQGVVTATQEPRTATVTGDITIGRRGGAIGPDGEPNTNPDGYAIFKLVRQGVVDEAMRTSQHAAILSTTNLGTPLISPPTIAIWPGHFSTKNHPTQTAVDFYIDFVAKKVGFINPARDGIGEDGGAGETDNRPAATIIPGIHLNVGFTDAGTMSGFASLDDLRGNNALHVFGLIGQEGFVATFVDLATDNKNFGGITASNPSHPDYEPPAEVLDVAVEDRAADSDAGKVNYSDWVGSFEPQTTPSSPRESEILQTTTYTDGIRGFAGLTNGTSARAFDFSTHAYFRSRLLRGDAKNGFAVLEQGGNYYTGVLHTADLGAPIRTASGRAEWRAFLIVQDSPGGAATEIRKRFDLTVIFGGGGNGEITGKVKDNIDSKRSPVIYGVDGNYDPRGVITGTFTRTAGQITAPISGIIGQTGAIGVFASNAENNKFAGGFVAVPHQVQDVTYSGVWKATHDAGRDGLFATPQTYNHWLEGGKADLNGQSTENISAGSLVDLPRVSGILRLSTGSWRLAPLGGDAADGVAYYTGVRGGARYFYSGITSGTDLGKPLTQDDGTATWYGQMSVRQNTTDRGIVTNYGDIEVILNFSGTGGTITGGLPTHRLNSPGYAYDIAGWFNEDGFVDGNVNTRTTSGGLEIGFLSGLIGQQGIVGAFIAPNVAGGFVAVPNEPSKVGSKYEDYIHYAQQRGHAVTNVPHGESDRWNELLLTENAAPYNISWGHIQQNRGAERDSFSVTGALSAIEHTPNANFTGGFSYLAGYWGDNGLNAFEDRSNINRAYHAAIHPNVDVGLPLGPTSHVSSPTLTWWGYFVAHQNKTFDAGVTTSTRVPFLVNYGADTISVDYRRNGNSALIGGIYSISGENGLGNVPWDDRGVLTGEIRHKDAHIPDGKLTGLIGRYGMVAVFVSDVDDLSTKKPHYGYAGGFVACPTVQINGVGGCR